MDSIFDRMSDMLNLIDSDDSDTDGSVVEVEPQYSDSRYDIEIKATTVAMREIVVPDAIVNIKRKMIEVVEFDEKNNLLDAKIREEFKNEQIYKETHIFTLPVPTTSTVEGYLSNVSFHEQNLIIELMPDDKVVLCRCNYGKVKYDGYHEPVKVKKTNRGRKKQPKKKKNRKKQGNGTDFNSQITFFVKSSIALELNTLLKDVYKIKVFRTGKIQLPGVHLYCIDDVITATKRITDMLNFHLHPGEPTPIVNVININPVMRNYKFVIKLPEAHIIDMNLLRTILIRERAAARAGQSDGPMHPPIFMIKYTRQETKLSIKFRTPIYKKPKKKTRINIFMRGKVNILGGFDAAVTYQICDYLHWLFETNFSSLVVPIGNFQNVGPTWQKNIMQYGDYDQIMDEFIHYVPECYNITYDDYIIVVEFIQAVYDELIEEMYHLMDYIVAALRRESYIME